MPNIDTATLPNAIKTISYNEDIQASKVVGIDVLYSGSSIADGDTNALSDVLILANPYEYTYTIDSDGEDDLQLGAVSIGSVVNCSINITTDPSSVLVEPGSTTDLIFEVTPTTPGAFSYTITINSDAPAPEDVYTINVTGTWTEFEYWKILSGGSVGNRNTLERSVDLYEDGGVGNNPVTEAAGVVYEGGSAT